MAVSFRDTELDSYEVEFEEDEAFYPGDVVEAFGDVATFNGYEGDKHASVTFHKGYTETVSINRITRSIQ